MTMPSPSSDLSNSPPRSGISQGAVAMIASSIALFFILLSLAIYLLWRRRYTIKSHHQELTNSNIPIAEELDGQPRSEMEDATRLRRIGSVIAPRFEPVEMPG
ncbi:hypothetical protein NHQ30_003284 [Ciborinia camelliae]|nr:hypothetical protein NHQ30_003284 [Ciborinia camelliae]